MAILKHIKQQAEDDSSLSNNKRRTSDYEEVMHHTPHRQQHQYDYWSFGTATASPNNTNNSIRFVEDDSSPRTSSALGWSHSDDDHDDDDDGDEERNAPRAKREPTEKSALLGRGNDSTTSLTISMGSNDDSSSDNSLNFEETITTEKNYKPSPWKSLASSVSSGEFFASSCSSSMTAKSERQKKRQDAQDSIRNSMEFSLTTCVIAVLLYMGVAVVAFSYVFDDFTIIDSCYFAVVTFTTIGYGDLVPDSLQGRIFTCFFAVSGVAFLGIALGVLGSRLVEAQERTMQRASELSRRRAMSLFTGSTTTSSSEAAALQQQEQEEEEKKQKQGLKHIMLELAAVGILLVIFASVLMNDPGIDVNRSASWCRQWGNAIYYVLITATTVGYGDFSPASQTGRLLAIFFITLSVGAMGHWLSLVAGYIMEQRQSELRKQMQAKELTMEDLEVMDEDGDGQVTQIEFLEFMLVAMNKVDSETVQGLKEYFHRLDRDGNGTLSKEDLVDTVKGKLPPGLSSARRKLELSSYKNELLEKARTLV